MSDTTQGSQSKFSVFISTLFLAALTVGLVYMAKNGPFPDSVFSFMRTNAVKPVSSFLALVMGATTVYGIRRLIRM